MIVAPAMILELVLSLNLFVYRVDIFSILNGFFISIIWLSTFFLQVPIHDKISKSYNTGLIKKLILSNWIRTFSWFFKIIICVFAYKLHE